MDANCFVKTIWTKSELVLLKLFICGEFALYLGFWRISPSQSPDIYLKNISVQVWVCWVVSCMQQEAMTVLWWERVWRCTTHRPTPGGWSATWTCVDETQVRLRSQHLSIYSSYALAKALFLPLKSWWLPFFLVLELFKLLLINNYSAAVYG